MRTARRGQGEEQDKGGGAKTRMRKSWSLPTSREVTATPGHLPGAWQVTPVTQEAGPHLSPQLQQDSTQPGMHQQGVGKMTWGPLGRPQSPSCHYPGICPEAPDKDG